MPSVIGNQRGGLFAVGREPAMQNLGSVVGAQRLAMGGHLRDTIFDPLYQRRLIDLKLDHRIEAAAMPLEHAVERFGLRNSSGKTVENKTLARVGLFDAIFDNGDDNVVRTKRATRHDVRHLTAE